MKICLSALLLTFLLSTGAQADPMRPFAPAAASAAASGAVAAPAPARAAATADPVRPPLLAIRIDADGRRQALIGEQWFAPGARVNDQLRVVAIEGNRVDIQRGKSRSSLHLLPPLVSSAAAPISLPRATALATP